MLQVDTIGTVERVDFPGLKILEVPAKIDTGADSSSLWATDVRENADDSISFVVFGPGSRFYTGTRVTVRDYRKVLVKNSSGIGEFRFKVRLLLQIGNRKIRAWFTLADRSEMKYPVLLGRRLLKNKFIVDVSKKLVHASAKTSHNVLVFGGTGRRLKGLLDPVSVYMEHDVEFVPRSLSQIAFWLGPSGIKVYETVTGRDIADFDLVIFKSHRRYYEFAIAAAEYLKFCHVPFLDGELGNHVVYDKLAEAVRLSIYGVLVPETFCASKEVLKEIAAEVIEKIGSPFVCKEINADRSRENYLLSDVAELQEVLKSADDSKIFIVQRYIENDGFIRALVLGSEPKLAISREAVVNARPRKRHLNTPAGSVNATLLADGELPQGVSQTASWAAKVMNRQIAGVDLIQEKRTGKWFVLEVNTSPQIRTGAFTDEKSKAFAKFIDQQLN